LALAAAVSVSRSASGMRPLAMEPMLTRVVACSGAGPGVAPLACRMKAAMLT
jgi:hypothetical protein